MRTAACRLCRRGWGKGTGGRAQGWAWRQPHAAQAAYPAKVARCRAGAGSQKPCKRHYIRIANRNQHGSLLTLPLSQFEKLKERLAATQAELEGSEARNKDLEQVGWHAHWWGWDRWPRHPEAKHEACEDLGATWDGEWLSRVCHTVALLP